MGRINLAERLERHNREQAGRAFGTGVAALLMWAGWYGFVYAVAWFVFNVLMEDGFDYHWWMPHAAALGAAVLVGLFTIPFLMDADKQIDDPEEPGALDSIFTQGHQAAGQALFAFLMIIPKTTATAYHDFTGRGSLTDAELRIGQRIVDALHAANNWLPAERFDDPADLPVLAKLLRLGFIWSRQHHGRYEVRLDPSLFD